MSSTVVTFPDSQHAGRRVAASRLREASNEFATAERHLADVTLALIAGVTGLSRVGASDDAVIREARQRRFAALRRLDELHFELLAPEHHALTPGDEDDFSVALTHRLRLNEEERADDGEFDRLTPACVGVTTRW